MAAPDEKKAALSVSPSRPPLSQIDSFDDELRFEEKIGVRLKRREGLLTDREPTVLELAPGRIGVVAHHEDLAEVASAAGPRFACAPAIIQTVEGTSGHPIAPDGYHQRRSGNGTVSVLASSPPSRRSVVARSSPSATASAAA